ncbi:MAG: hypothetical protein I3273_01775 [Candidatus Moeniiplasma glomeromycotorum]|nr:hypothetical protein [Candidatus Moeniiplasma glomeromycotorum]MCE8167150.1 hypothetical protein [Candidatus Moeniiplasma glomeromycotorum]MCE8168838.1 hypothetical protein [Candidatus Moeniiplasma glomeromycotorum]
MILVPFEYLKRYLFLPPLAPAEIATKLTYFSLETQLVKKKDQFHLEFNPLPNRADLFCWWGIVQEIKTLLNCSEKPFNLVTLKQSKKTNSRNLEKEKNSSPTTKKKTSYLRPLS